MSIPCHSEVTFDSGFEMQWLEELKQKDAENKRSPQWDLWSFIVVLATV